MSSGAIWRQLVFLGIVWHDLEPFGVVRFIWQQQERTPVRHIMNAGRHAHRRAPRVLQRVACGGTKDGFIQKPPKRATM